MFTFLSNAEANSITLRSKLFLSWSKWYVITKIYLVEQPNTVQSHFSEKAITFLEDYTEAVVDQIQRKLREKPHVVVHADSVCCTPSL